jgi:serine/threonine protein kinase
MLLYHRILLRNAEVHLLTPLHKRGVVHKNINPTNILIDNCEQPVL